MKPYRLNCLFSAHCFDVAVGDGFGDPVLSGIENIEAANKTPVKAALGAIQLSPGRAHCLQNIVRKDRPALGLGLRTDFVLEQT